MNIFVEVGLHTHNVFTADVDTALFPDVYSGFVTFSTAAALADNFLAEL